MSVRLRKWYLDCVTEDGDAAVVYAGQVSCGPATVPYVEVLTGRVSQPVTRRRRFSRRAHVTETGRDLSLDAPAIGVTGRWVSHGPRIDLTLFDDQRGSIVWRCRQPGGAATVHLPEGPPLSGLGYAEELEMTIAPWAVPFKALRWGRCVTGRRSVVWIDWRVGLTRRWVFVDGAPVEALGVEQDGVAWPGARLTIDAGRVLRQGSVGRTVAGPLGAWLPRLVETKWIARGSISDESGNSEAGWVIHELVRWS